MYRHLLVPLDTTDLSAQVVSNAVGLARGLGARITFFHAMEVDAVAPASQARRDELEGPARELLAKAEAGARAAGVPCESRLVRGQQAATAIVGVARELGCDLIFMASHGRGGRLGMAVGSDTLSVLIEAGLPVLVSSTGATGAPERAIAVIRDEHRALAAVIHAAAAMLGAARELQQPVDAGAMRSVVSYLRGFPATHHHPKEEEHLFPRVRAHTNELDAELDELQRQHERDRAGIEELARHVDALEQADSRSGRIGITLELHAALARYAELHWEHMGREETVVLPAAQAYFDAADWEALNAAFAAPLGPVPVDAASMDYRQLLAQIARAQDEARERLANRSRT